MRAVSASGVSPNQKGTRLHLDSTKQMPEGRVLRCFAPHSVRLLIALANTSSAWIPSFCGKSGCSDHARPAGPHALAVRGRPQRGPCSATLPAAPCHGARAASQT